MNIKFFISDTWACGHVRGEVPARHINSQTAHQMVCKSDVLYSDMFKTDVMIFQRQSNSAMLPQIEEARRRGIRVVYDIDDDLFSIPPESKKAHEFYSKPEVQSGLMMFMNSCDAIISSTQHLAEQIRSRTTRPIFIVENGVDFDYWNSAFERHLASNKEEVTIGWMASGTHLIDAVLLSDVLPPLFEEFPQLRAHLIGWVDAKDFGPGMKRYASRVTTHPWIDISELPDAMSDFDIGLAPLVDNRFNRSKSAVKYLQYSALGIPCVASPCLPYIPLIQHGVNGFIADDNNPEAWTECLRSLIVDKSKRLLVGCTARLQMRARYDVSKASDILLSTLDVIRRCE